MPIMKTINLINMHFWTSLNKTGERHCQEEFNKAVKSGKRDIGSLKNKHKGTVSETNNNHEDLFCKSSNYNLLSLTI